MNVLSSIILVVASVSAHAQEQGSAPTGSSSSAAEAALPDAPGYDDPSLVAGGAPVAPSVVKPAPKKTALSTGKAAAEDLWNIINFSCSASVNVTDITSTTLKCSPKAVVGAPIAQGLNQRGNRFPQGKIFGASVGVSIAELTTSGAVEASAIADVQKDVAQGWLPQAQADQMIKEDKQRIEFTNDDALTQDLELRAAYTKGDTTLYMFAMKAPGLAIGSSAESNGLAQGASIKVDGSTAQRGGSWFSTPQVGVGVDHGLGPHSKIQGAIMVCHNTMPYQNETTDDSNRLSASAETWAKNEHLGKIDCARGTVWYTSEKGFEANGNLGVVDGKPTGAIGGSYTTPKGQTMIFAGYINSVYPQLMTAKPTRDIAAYAGASVGVPHTPLAGYCDGEIIRGFPDAQDTLSPNGIANYNIVKCGAQWTILKGRKDGGGVHMTVGAGEQFSLNRLYHGVPNASWADGGGTYESLVPSAAKDKPYVLIRVYKTVGLPKSWTSHFHKPTPPPDVATTSVH